MGDVGEGAAVDDGGVVFQGLDQVGLDGVLEQDGHGAFRLQVMGGDRLTGAVVAHDDARQALLQVHQVGGQAEDCHNFGGNGDVKAVFPGHALHPAANAVDDVAELPVVHVHAATPGDVLHVDVQLVPLLDVVVQHRGQQVVGCADGVEVTGEVEVDVLHGDDLSVAAASGTALDAEDGAQGGFSEAEHGVLAQLGHGVCQAHTGGGLTLPGGGGVDGGDQDQLGLAGGVPEGADVDLGLDLAVIFQQILVDARFFSYLADGKHGRALSDLNIRLDAGFCVALGIHGQFILSIQLKSFVSESSGHKKTPNIQTIPHSWPRRSAHWLSDNQSRQAKQVCQIILPVVPSTSVSHMIHL